MGKYNFDQLIDRHGSGAMKVDSLNEFFGRDDLLGLWIADMDFAVSPRIREALSRRIEHPVYGYAGAPQSYWDSITGWLARRHNWNVKREEITYIPGVVKGIALAINFFTQRGDKVVIQPPVYHPFRMVTEGNGRVAVNNPLIFDGNNYRMDLEGLERIFRDEHPKMMILCNPHNPVGIQWSVEVLQEVARLAKKYGVTVVSDEIHADLMLYGKPHFPFASVSPEAAEVSITLGAPSKTFNIAGLVSSWCVVKNPKLREPFFHWLMVNEFDAPTFIATIGTEAAYTQGEDWLDEMLEYIEGTIAEVEEIVAEKLPDIKVIRPEASFLVWLDCRGLCMSHDELIKLFVNKAHLALNDGAMFGAEGNGFMRLNIGSPRSVIRYSLESLADALASVCAE
ncbi:MalY/PatB family protein [Muribaculum sp. NM65_B17]|uniref:MalY/PatB family protein n=2 Tax=Muribaculum TaxID=1918540 RepID=UPI001093B914|nr:MalY/PatB family protein [Muribaculum sp. NM65_B17]TGY04639.1 pyridoxal phosphate-dependent aminotransferase [Muribaculum sp. NM65_B17]THG44040.1 pyridoxal phosphate-dependent aminotransferase [Muribaculaceae bacterium]